MLNLFASSKEEGDDEPSAESTEEEEEMLPLPPEYMYHQIPAQFVPERTHQRMMMRATLTTPYRHEPSPNFSPLHQRRTDDEK